MCVSVSYTCDLLHNATYIKKNVVPRKYDRGYYSLIRRLCVCDGTARRGSPEGRNSKDNIKIASKWKKKEKKEIKEKDDHVCVCLCVCACLYVWPFGGAVRLDEERMRRSLTPTLCIPSRNFFFVLDAEENNCYVKSFPLTERTLSLLRTDDIILLN